MFIKTGDPQPITTIYKSSNQEENLDAAKKLDELKEKMAIKEDKKDEDVQ